MNTIISGIKCLAISGLVLLSAYAQTMDEVIAKTVKRYDNLKTFQTEFTQTLCDEAAGMCSIYEGKLSFLKPNFFRMEIEKPAQVYVGDSVSLWIYMPDKKKAIRQAIGQIPFAINPNMFLEDYQEHFNAEFASADDGYEITLKPREETEIYSMITLLIDKKKYDIMMISIIDGAGTENKFVFSNTRINKNISRDVFLFQPPEGTEIIDQ
ncbi:MAG TPA: outer membrane lipoprotein chaperone LolA [bacterium]